MNNCVKAIIITISFVKYWIVNRMDYYVSWVSVYWIYWAFIALMSIHRMVACRTYFFSWRCVRSAFMVHGVDFHQYPLTDRLHFVGTQIVSCSSHRGLASTDIEDMILSRISTANTVIIHSYAFSDSILNLWSEMISDDFNFQNIQCWFRLTRVLRPALRFCPM